MQASTGSKIAIILWWSTRAGIIRPREKENYYKEQKQDG